MTRVRAVLEAVDLEDVPPDHLAHCRGIVEGLERWLDDPSRSWGDWSSLAHSSGHLSVPTDDMVALLTLCTLYSFRNPDQEASVVEAEHFARLLRAR